MKKAVTLLLLVGAVACRPQAGAEGVQTAPKSLVPARPVDPMATIDVAAIARTVAAVRGHPQKEPIAVSLLDEDGFNQAFNRHSEESFARDDGRRFGGKRPKDDANIYLAFYDEYAHVVLLRETLPSWTAAESAKHTPDETHAFVEGLVAHEVTHALQDQHFTLQRFTEEPDADRRRAYRALVEGDAETTRIAFEALRAGKNRATALHEVAGWSARDADELEDLGGISPALRASNRARRESVLFSYVQGARFVATVWERGGFPLVNSLYERPPRRTAEVFHPEFLLAGGERLVFPPLPAPPGFHGTEATVFGELATRNFLAGLLRKPAAVDMAADAALRATLAGKLRADRAETLVNSRGHTAFLWIAEFADEAAPQELARRVVDRQKDDAAHGVGTSEPLLVVAQGTRLVFVSDLPEAPSKALAEKLLALAPLVEKVAPLK